MSDRDRGLDRSTRRWMQVGLVVMVLLAAAFPAYRVYEPVQRAAAAEVHSASLADYGGELYGDNCASCHGENGRGGLGPAIGAMQFLVNQTNEQIQQLTSFGIPGSEMVAYSVDQGGSLTSQQIGAITGFLRSLEEEEIDLPDWRYPLLDVAAEEVFALACVRCHGTDLQGSEDIPAIGPDSDSLESTNEWMAKRIRQGGKTMPRFGGSLSEEQIQSLLMYIRDKQGIPFEPPPEEDAGPDSSTPPVDEPADDALLAAGKVIFEETAGGDGCASCHGVSGRGDGPEGDGAPNIRGASKSAIRSAYSGGIPIMTDYELTEDELVAVAAYVKYLATLP